MLLTLCFSCCHRWHRIFWSRSLPDSCLLRSCLSLQVWLSIFRNRMKDYSSQRMWILLFNLFQLRKIRPICFTINLLNVCRFYARASSHYVELDASSKSAANFLDGHSKRSTHSSRPLNYPATSDVTVDHVTTGNGQYFVLDAEAINREAFLSTQQRNLL